MTASDSEGPKTADAKRVAAAAAAPLTFTDRRQVIALWAGFVLFVLGLGAALYLATKAADIRVAARRQADIQAASRDLLTAVIDSQNGQRGFLLTGDESFLEPYFVSRIAMQADYRALKDLAAADPVQAARVGAVQPLLEYKIAELEQTVDLARQGQKSRAIAIVAGDTNRRNVAALRAKILEVNDVATGTLGRARARLDRYSVIQQTVIIASIFMGLLLVTVVARARSRILRDLANQNLLLEERVRERTSALEARSKRIETLIQDMSHRVGNSLSLVTGFLDLQARASKSDEVKGALAAARQRVFSIASAQRRMRLAMDSDTVESRFFLESLIDDFRNALPDGRITIEMELENISLPSLDASAFGVILNELLANAIKHAWKAQDQGVLKVNFSRIGDENVLRVCDDGRGDARQDSSGGLGQVLLQSLVQSIKGTQEFTAVSNDAERPGLCCIVRAPA